MTSYLIDSNVFNQAKNLHYGFDFCPAFWNWLVEQNVSMLFQNWPTMLLQ